MHSRMRQSAVTLALCVASFAAHAQQGDADATLQETRITGDQELPIGLYISPWRSANPEAEFDRPARQLDVQPELLDPEVFARQIEYYNALAAAMATRP